MIVTATDFRSRAELLEIVDSFDGPAWIVRFDGVVYRAELDADGYKLTPLAPVPPGVFMRLTAFHRRGDHDQAKHGRKGARGVASIQPADSAALYKDPATGAYTPERRALHEQIIQDMLGDHAVQDNPEIVLLGGGPAAGKTTVLNSGQFPVPEDHVPVAADKVKERLPEANPSDPLYRSDWGPFLHEESSDVADEVLARSYARRANIVLDGTGLRADEKVALAHTNGYKATGRYVSIDTGVALERAQSRAAIEDRTINPAVVTHKHAKVSNELPRFAPLFDEVSLHDNTGPAPRLIMSGKGGRLDIVDQQLWDEFVAKGVDSGFTQLTRNVLHFTQEGIDMKLDALAGVSVEDMNRVMTGAATGARKPSGLSSGLSDLWDWAAAETAAGRNIDMGND